MAKSDTTMYQTSHWMAVHTGGTKFYEALHVKNTNTGKGVVAFRWGADATRSVKGGGQSSISSGSDRDYDSKVREKRGRGYTSRMAAALGSQTFVGITALKDALTAQYGAAYAQRILAELASPGSAVKIQPPEVEEGPEWMDETNDRVRANEAALRKEREERINREKLEKLALERGEEFGTW